MSAPKGPPKARHLLVPPLTSKTENGELYKRRADVEDSIAQVLAQPPSEWVAIATAKGEHRLADEALVFLIRAAGSGLPDVIGGLVSGRNNPNISSDGASSADPLEFVFLQNAQQSDLGFGRKLSNFVKKDYAPFGQFKASQAPLSCPSEGAFLMAEQLRGDQVTWNGCAIHTHKRV